MLLLLYRSLHGIDRVRFTLFGPEIPCLAAINDLAGQAGFGTNYRLSQLALVPRDVHFETTSRRDAGDFSSWPSRWQCGQQIDLTGVALHQHLAVASGRPQVTVDLEWRVRAKQVRVDPAATYAVDHFGRVNHVDQTT